MARYGYKKKKEEEEKKKKQQTVSARAMRNDKARQANAGKTVKSSKTSSGKTNKQTTVKKSANRSSRTMGNNKGLFANSRLFNRKKNDDKIKSTTSKNRGSAISNNKKGNENKIATSAVARRAGLTQNDYKKLEKKTENRKKVVSSTLRQVVGSHAKALATIGPDNKKAYETPAKGKYATIVSKPSYENKKKLSDWASKQIEKGNKEYEKATKNMSKTGKFGADVANAAIGLATDAATGPMAPVTMFSRAYGSAYHTAEKEGADHKQAVKYGLAKGAVEAATEKIGSVAKPLQKVYGKGIADDLAERVAKKMATKAKTQVGKNVAYHGGKTVAAMTTEAIEEMIAEGLDPVIANNLYANEVGKPHSTSAKDILYAGAVGGALGGILGAGGQVVEYSRGSNVQDIYGEDGVKQLAKVAKESDEESDAFTAEALDKMINEGGGIAAGQALQLKQAVEKQNAKDRLRIQDMNAATDQIIKNKGLVNIIKKVDENGTLELSDNTRSVYEGAKAKAMDIATAKAEEIAKSDEKHQLKDITIDEITSEVASIVTGAVTNIDTVNTFTTSNTLARKIYEETTGEKLPATNRETREYLYTQIAKNRQSMLEAETGLYIDKIKGVVQQDVGSTYDAEGQKAFSEVMSGTEVRSGMAVNNTIVTFEDYYEAGRMGMSLQEMSDLKNPVYDILSPEQKVAAYNAGVNDGMAARNFASQRAQDIKLTLGQKADKNGSETKPASPRGKIFYEFESVDNKSKFTASQQTMFQSLAEKFNINIHITDNPDYNGNYQNGEVWMSVDADRDLSYVFSHEITHHLQKYAPQEYNDFKELVRSAWGPENLNAAIRAKIDHYARHGVNLSREDAIDEILADSTYEMIQDEKFVNELCKEDRTLAKQILDALRSMIKKIRAMLAGEKKFTPAQNEGLLSQLDILKEAERLWEIGLKKAEENRDAVGMVEDTDNLYDGVDLSEEGYIYDYDFLTKLPDMHVVSLPEIAHVVNADGKIDRADIATKGLANVASVSVDGTGDIVTNIYTGRELRVTGTSIRHGLNGDNKRMLTNARAGSVIGDIIKNAVPVNALHDATKNTNVNGTYAMVGYAKDSNNREFVVVVTVEQMTGNISYEVIHSLSGRIRSSKNKNSNLADTKSQGLIPSEVATISIADLLEIVNETHKSILSNDVLARLGETRPANGYYTGRVKFSFKGENAVLSEEEKNNLQVAKKMQNEGKNNQEIYNETGWYTQSDGKWRTEMLDEIMVPENFSRTGLQSAKDARADKYIADAEKKFEAGDISEEDYEDLIEYAEEVRNMDYNISKLPNYLNAPKLYEAYPRLRSVTLVFKQVADGQGYTDISANEIALDPEGLHDAGLTVREALAHEIQHWIQEIEGFTPGSTPKAAGSYDAYYNTGGEIEARDVEERLRWTPEERRKFMPTQFSLKDSEGRELSANQAEYFKDSKARDENGDLLALYHGTAAGEFYVFDKSKGDVEGDFGSGFYFSNNESDMERNYEGGGPDFENKVQREADLMESIEDIDHDEAERIVRERLYVAPNRFEVYLNIKNPAIVGETLLLTPEDFDPGYDIDDFDNEDEYYEQVDQDMQDALDELVLDIERNVDIDLGGEEIGGVLYEAFAEGGISIEALKDKMSEIYLTDSEGDFASNEVVRQIIESLGYDGIIDPTVSRKWKNMGLTPDTKHFIVFKPEQIKYVNNENPTTNHDIRYSFKDSEGNSLSPQQAEYFADSKIRDENGNLKVMYHGSPETFTVFDPVRNGGKNGIGEGFGIYLTDSEEIATPYSNNGNLMKGYVNITNPATAFEKTIAKDDLIKLIKATCEKEAQEYVDDGEYDTIEEALRDTWISNYVDTYKGKIDMSYKKAADVILDYNENDRDIVQEVMVGSGANTYSSAYKFYDVLNETLGIDGFLVRWGDESNYAEVALAFNSNQFKNIDNENPTEDPDIRYSFKDDINVSVDDVNEYVNAHPEEFAEVMQYFYSEQQAHHTRQKTMQELQSQLEKMKVDKKLTHGRVLDPKSIEEDANSLVRMMLSYKEENTKLTDHKLVKMIQANAKDIFAYLKDGDQESAITTAYHVAEELISKLNMVNDEMFQQYKELRDYLRTTRVYIPNEYLGDFPDMATFRSEQMGRIRIVNEESGGTSVDKMYEQLLEMFPGMFDETLDNPADQMYEIRDVREQLDPYEIVLNHEETEQLIKEAAHDILELAVNGKPWKSWADRNKEVYDEKIRALKQKHQEAVRDVRLKEKERAEKKIEAVRAKADERLQQAKEKGEQKLQEEKQKNKERQQNQRDNRDIKEYIRKMENQISWLSDRLLKPTDDKHLPEGYQKAIAQLLYSIDTQTERSKKLEEKYGLSKKRLKFLELKDQYEKIAAQADSDILLDEDIANELSTLAELLEDQPISEATPAQLEQIYKVLRNITHGIRMVNQAFVEGQRETISEMAEDTIERAKEIVRHIFHKDRSGMIGGLDSILNESMVTPRDFFERIGGGIEQAYMGIRKGFDRHVDNITVARTFFEGMFRKYYNKKKPGSALEKWRDSSTNETFQLDQGGEITLNVAQRMSLYCLMKREQAQGHILGSGIVATEVDVKSRIKQALGAKVDTKASTSRVTWFDIDKILKTLTKEQMEMADELMSFLNNECAAWGNEVSMRLYGYEKFTEEYYFPIKSADVYLDSKFDGRTSVERIRNFGFTKGTVVNANNPIVIDDIFSVISDHINHMSMYSAFAAPIADFTRVYNYKVREEDGTITASTKAALQDAYGKKVGSYITKFMADLQSNTQTRTEGLTRLVNKSLANYKKATIAGNIRVALQQPTAICRAFMLISPKYFTGLNAKKNMQRMKEHCQIARWKAWGHNQVDMARDIDDIMMNNEWTKLDLFTMQIYGALDTVTWSYIWGAVEKEIRAKHPNVVKDSDEYFELCNERASEIFDKTQVVDSVLHRSEVMRNQDTMSKMVTSFMAEPTRTYNMVRGQYAKALDQWHDGEKGKATATAAKTTYIFLANAMACAMAAAVADALRGKDLDDDDEPEEWFEHVINNFKGNANPLMMIPVISEALEYWQGWGSQNMALEGIESLMTSTKALVDKMNGEGDESWRELFRKEAEAIGLVFGVPVKNVWREIETFGKLLGWEASAATETEESDGRSLFEKIDDKDLLSIKDGSLIDNILNHFGWNLTDAERAERERQRLIKEYEGKLEGLTGTEREEKMWSLVMRGYTTDLKDGNLAAIEERRKILKAMGGDMDYFKERVEKETVNAYRKTIGSDNETGAILKEYLMTEYGYTEGKISQQIIAKSDVAKQFQLALCANNEDAAVDALAILIDAGITYQDADVLFNNMYDAVKTSDVATGELSSPVSGTVTSSFGYRTAPTAGASTYHEGIDIGAPAGSVVGAADGGKVSSCGYNKTKGYYVKISHGNGRYTEYFHLEGFCVSKGQAVAAGQEIGRVGSTGVSTGPHLHFAVIESGVHVDPAPYLD
jgi:murein DD-endopeptidase MepM/ murein hydrolase activator NlpD